jgi:hypothetical protein
MRTVAHRWTLLGAWLATRAFFVAIVLHRIRVYELRPSNGDVHTYRGWSRILAHGHYPVHDPQWQYPPLAGPLLLLPRVLRDLSGMTYFRAFLVLAILADGIILAVLALHGGARLSGAWFWLAWPFLLGPIGFARYDLFATLAAVLALVVLPRLRWFGTLAAVGTMLKVWPLFLLLALPRRRAALGALATFGGTVVACLLGGLLIGGNQLSFLTGQSDRGVEVEAVAATPFHIVRALGWHGVSSRHRYGSQELVGSGIHAAATLCLAATAIAVGAIAVLALRRRPEQWDPAFGCDVALVVTLASVVTSRVLSPQYFIWLLGVGAVCLIQRGSRQRPTVALILLATLATHLEYPYAWTGLKLSTPHTVAVLTVRNLLLVAALGAGFWALRRRPVETAEPDAVRDVIPATR